MCDLNRISHNAVAKAVQSLTNVITSIRAEYWYYLAIRLDDRYSRTGSMDDLQEAIHMGQAALDANPEDHTHRAKYLNNLGIRLCDRYSRTGLMDDLQEAIRLEQAALDATPEDHPDRPQFLNNLQIILTDR